MIDIVGEPGNRDTIPIRFQSPGALEVIVEPLERRVSESPLVYASIYESGGREFESLRARQLSLNLLNYMPRRPTPLPRRVAVEAMWKRRRRYSTLSAKIFVDINAAVGRDRAREALVFAKSCRALRARPSPTLDRAGGLGTP
jgi:hypothetical protein